jgi:CspA family cold shock protein
MSDRLEGKVKWFNSTKGFGFIEADGQEYFVHFNAIKMDGYKRLDDGQQVVFSPSKTDRGLSAVDVEPC